jgi:hypothetical protein
LLILVGGRWAEDSHSHELARGSAIEIIRAGGIQLNEEIVPQDTALPALQARRDLNRETELATVLLGGQVTVEALGGEVYRCGNEKGWIQFHSTGEFMAELEDGAFPLTQEAARHAAGLLAGLDFDSRVLEDTVKNGTGSVALGQLLDGVPVLNCQAVLHYRDGELVSITQGSRVPGESALAAGGESMSVVTALMRLYNGLKELGDIYTSIESITPAYTMSVSLSGPARLDPVWHIKTDTGAYEMDIHTGRLGRLESVAMAAETQTVLTEE